jgi:hypothetical protein
MKAKPFPLSDLGWCLIALALLPCGQLGARAADLKLEVQLLWATDDAKSPNPKHKPVEPDLKQKLKHLPLKWANYFAETREVIEVPQGASKRVTLSERCEIDVKNLDGLKVEVTHFGKGKKVATRTQELPKAEILVLGGNAPNATAWLVVLKRIE